MLPRTVRTGLLLALALVASVLALSGPADSRVQSTGTSGCHVQGELEACFSVPQTHHGFDPAVIAHASAMFDRAGAGDTIRIAMFRWDLAKPADALIKAQQRGAHVVLVVDHDVVTKKAGNRLVRTIRAHGKPGDVVVCTGACLPWSGRGPAPPAQNINHLKLFLFDIGGQQSVAFTSSNLEVRQYHQVNSWLRVTDPAVYRFQSAYFHRLHAQSWRGWGDRQKSQVGDPSTFVYPRHGDPILATLGQVHCTPKAHTVDVLWAVIQRYDVRRRLGLLDRQGCLVRIVTTRDQIENWLQAKVRVDGGVIDIPNDRVRTLLIHDKGVSIHAMVGGRERWIVLTGTSNATCGGLLYNDEAMVRVNGKWAFRQYDAHFRTVYGLAHQSHSPVMPVQRHCR